MNNERSGRITYYKHLLPSELNLKEIIEVNPPHFVYNFDFFCHLIHLTIEIPARKKKLLRKNGFVPFRAFLLQLKNRQYAIHLKYLVQNGVLDEDRQYLVGTKSRCYRIAEKYLSEKLNEIEITDAKLLRQLDKEPRVDFPTTIRYKNLHQYFNPDLKIDVDGAMNHCLQVLQEQRKENYYEAYSFAYARILKIKMLAGGYYWFNQDTFGNRLHTNITNLDKDLKQFVTYGGLSLVSVDLKNSQPYLSLKILKEKIPQLDLKGVIHNSKDSEDYLPVMIVNKPETENLIDVYSFAGLVATGKLYEYMVDEVKKHLGEDYFTGEYRFDFDKKLTVKNTLGPRDRVKVDMFQVFFSKNETRTSFKELFTNLFPTVMEVFSQYKANRHVVGHDRHKELARRLQRIESHLMLDRIVPELSRLKPDMPIFTIHDSITTTVGNELFVAEVMEYMLSEAIGVNPTLKIEHWNKEYAPLKVAA